jgi:hypothetical protein
LAGYDGGAGGRANLAGGVAISEAHAGFGEGVDMGRLVKGGALAGEVLDAKVIGKDENDVGFGCYENRQEADRREKVHIVPKQTFLVRSFKYELVL